MEQNNLKPWTPKENNEPVSGFIYHPPTFEETDPELMSITERHARQARYAEATRRLEPSLSTILHRKPLTNTLAETYIDRTSLNNSVSSVRSSQACAANIRTAKAMRLRKGEVKVVYIETGKNVEKEKPEWTANMPIMDSNIDASSFLSPDRLTSLQRLDNSSGAFQENGFRMGSESPKEARTASTSRVRGRSFGAAENTRTLATPETSTACEVEINAELCTHRRSLPSTPTAGEEAQIRHSILAKQCIGRSKPGLDIWEVTAETTVEHLVTDEASTTTTLPTGGIKPQESSCTLVIRKIKAFSEIRNPAIPHMIENRQTDSHKEVDKANGAHTSYPVDSRFIDCISNAMDVLLHLASLLAEVPHKSSSCDSDSVETLCIDEIETFFDLADYINVNLTTSPTLKDLIYIFIDPSSETRTKLSRSWMEKVQKEVNSLLIAAEKLKMMANTNDFDSKADWDVRNMRKTEKLALFDAVDCLLEVVEGFAKLLYRGSEK